MSERAARFDSLYADNPDPWSFETSDYEQGKYAATLSALSRERYGHALEVGCSIGVLTSRLAERCARLVALDVSAIALSAAAARCEAPHVSFVRGEVPGDWPCGAFDLIVFSEVLYFLAADEVLESSRLSARNLAQRGEIILVNWLGENDCTLSGDAAADLFVAEAVGKGLLHQSVRRERLYRIDRIFRTGG